MPRPDDATPAQGGAAAPPGTARPPGAVGIGVGPDGTLGAPAAPQQPQPQAPQAPPAPPGVAPGSVEARLIALVAERPALAPGVELAGGMEESAFVEPQWLAVRDGQYVQLTELLYRLTEQLDGKKTLDEVARGLGERIDREVTADNVRQLVGLKLMPLGLVPAANGKVVKPETEAEGAARSPLSVNMKMAMLSPGLINAVSAVLTPLFWPPVLVVMLVAGAVGEWWLYFVHGVGSGVHDAIYNPALLVAALGIIVLATAFHEFGHAAALRYGGKRVRAMGVGIYLIYPAFYTDVTENYQLGRFARLRTDLGGVYFNLIAALGIIAAYAATRWEFLLVGVVLLNYQTIQQFFPFVRLDGYWVLADMTGIPDFFSYMGAFVRGVLRLPGRKLPEMKWWGKAVFAGYILIVVPLLAVMLFLAIKAFPRIVATALDSFGQQAQAFGGALGSGDVLGAIAYAVYMVLLALPALGIAYVLFSLGRTAVTLLWRWSAGSAPKRVAAAFGTAAAAFLIAWLWAPQIPAVLGGAPQPVAAQSPFQPIGAQERGTLPDFAGGATVERAPADVGTEITSALPFFSGGAEPSPVTATPVVDTPTPAPQQPSGGLAPQTDATGTPAAGTDTQPLPTPTPVPPQPTPPPPPPPPTDTPVPAPPASSSGSTSSTTSSTTSGGTAPAPAPTSPPPPPPTNTPAPANTPVPAGVQPLPPTPTPAGFTTQAVSPTAAP